MDAVLSGRNESVVAALACEVTNCILFVRLESKGTVIITAPRSPDRNSNFLRCLFMSIYEQKIVSTELP